MVGFAAGLKDSGKSMSRAFTRARTRKRTETPSAAVTVKPTAKYMQEVEAEVHRLKLPQLEALVCRKIADGSKTTLADVREILNPVAATTSSACGKRASRSRRRSTRWSARGRKGAATPLKGSAAPWTRSAGTRRGSGRPSSSSGAV